MALHSLPLTHSRISMEISTSLSLPLSGWVCHNARCCVICGIKVATTSCPLPLSALEMYIHACTILDKSILWQAITSIVVLCVIAAKCKQIILLINIRPIMFHTNSYWMLTVNNP
jgi:hypothetical protein